MSLTKSQKLSCKHIIQAQGLRRSVDAIIGRTALKFLAI